VVKHNGDMYSMFRTTFTPPSGGVNVPACHFSHDQVGHCYTKRAKGRGLSLQTVGV